MIKLAALLALSASLLEIPSTCEAQNPFRWYFRTKTVTDTTTIQPDTSRTLMRQSVSVVPLTQGRYKVTTVLRKTRMWAGPSVGFDAFSRESGTGKYVSGIIPGVGYGLKWGRPNADPTKDPTAFLALDVFVQGVQVDDDPDTAGNDHFNIDVLPVMTLLNWISVGYGPRFKTGLDGHSSSTKGVFTFGIKKAP